MPGHCAGLFAVSVIVVSRALRVRLHSSAHSSSVEFSRIRTLISVGFVITLLRSSLNSFHLLPSVNIYFDVIRKSGRISSISAFSSGDFPFPVGMS